MKPEQHIPIENITVSGVESGIYYPVWINDWGRAHVNLDAPISLDGWLFLYGEATGPIEAIYIVDDYEDDPDLPKFLATKAYADAEKARASVELQTYLPKVGGLMSAPFTIKGDCEEFDLNSAITVEWAESKSDLFLKVEGGAIGSEEGGQVMEGPITLHSTFQADYNQSDAIPRFYLEDNISEVITTATLANEDLLSLEGDIIREHISVPEPQKSDEAANLGYLNKYLLKKTKEYFEGYLAEQEGNASQTGTSDS